MDVHTHILPRTWPDLKERYGYGGFIKLDHHHECKAKMMRDDGTFFREVEKRTWDPDTRMAEANRIRMNVQVLSTVPVMFSYWAKPADALDVSQMLNDHIAGCVAANPTRFVGLGTLPMQDPDLACDELKRCVNELGLAGERAGSCERRSPGDSAACPRPPAAAGPRQAPCPDKHHRRLYACHVGPPVLPRRSAPAGVEIGTHVNDWTLSEPELFKVFKTAESLGAAVFIHP